MDILIPCKALSRGKSRLSPVLSPGARAGLCRRLLTDTLACAALTGARVAVVTDDAAVASIAHAAGVRVLPDPGAGLNAALAAGAAALVATGPLVILPIDLPGLTPGWIVDHAGHPGVTLVPDSAGCGTNLMILDRMARAGFPFAYGPGSFSRHRDTARNLGLPVTVLHDPHLATDIDTPADLALLPARLRHFAKGIPHEAA